MSQYLNFYIKSDNKFLPLFSYSRNSAIYEYANEYAPYDDGKIITSSIINSILNDIKYEEESYTPTLERIAEKKQLICQMNNSVDDKMQAIFDCNSELNEVNEIKDGLNQARIFYEFLDDILSNIEYDRYVTNKNEYLWFGIEWNPNYKENEDE